MGGREGGRVWLREGGRERSRYLGWGANRDLRVGVD